MDAGIASALDTLATTAGAFSRARQNRNPRYDWLTVNESEALANLRTSLAALHRAEEKAANPRKAA